MLDLHKAYVDIGEPMILVECNYQ